MVGKTFDEIVVECRQKTPRNADEKEIIEGAIIDARLEAQRARFEQARIPGMLEEERKKLLTDAVASLVDYEIDYGDRGKAFEAIFGVPFLRGAATANDLGDLFTTFP